MYLCNYICIFLYIIYCLLHNSGNTTRFTFVWLFFITRFNNPTLLIANYYKLYSPFDCCILRDLIYFFT